MNEVQPLKKYPKLVHVDARGQIVIPKDMRAELGIENGTGFWMFSIEKEGILLKKVDEPSFDDQVLDEVKKNADKVGVNPKHIQKSSEDYRKGKGGRLETL